MKRELELLAPGGDVDSIKAAVLAGANAVYCGLDKFNARNRATNMSFDDLQGIVRFAHQHNCQVFLTLNIIVVESELSALIGLLNKLVNTHIDGIIVQDFGVLYLLSHYFKHLSIHASTQLTTHNEGQILFLSKLNATRVNLSRELSLHEIKYLSEVAHQNNVLIEVFVHGSNCICFSGLCYISSVHGGNSGNRGRCSQPCRDQYITTLSGNNFPLNLKDNSAFLDLRALYDAGVDSLKIEGRIKKFHYVHTVVDAWRKHLDLFYAEGEVGTDNSALYKVFNREFTNGYLMENIGKQMFIDNPRDNSAIRLSKLNGCLSDANLDKAKGDIYDERTEIISSVEQKLQQYSVAKVPVTITVSGQIGSPLEVYVQTADSSFSIFSEIELLKNETQSLSYNLIFNRLKTANETAYYIENLNIDKLSTDTYLPFKELSSIRKQLLFKLNDSKEWIEPVTVPVLKKHFDKDLTSSLSVLISSKEDLNLISQSSAFFYFKLPSSLNINKLEIIELLSTNKNVTAWFPAVLIGDDYKAAVEILKAIKPTKIVTDNSGIAYEAYLNEIQWIAGPCFNVVNSFSLLCLKEEFNCSGAFISNEIDKIQLKGIKKPENFDLYFSVYHPIMLMTSRQCLFQQITGCAKDTLDATCLPHCEKSTLITNLKGEKFIVEKSKGNYHRIYNDVNLLNINIIKDIPNVFTSFFIDLSDVKTETLYSIDKFNIIKYFERTVNGDTAAEELLHQAIFPTTNVQYKKGI